MQTPPSSPCNIFRGEKRHEIQLRGFGLEVRRYDCSAAESATTYLVTPSDQFLDRTVLFPH